MKKTKENVFTWQAMCHIKWLLRCTSVLQTVQGIMLFSSFLFSKLTLDKLLEKYVNKINKPKSS